MPAEAPLLPNRSWDIILPDGRPLHAHAAIACIKADLPRLRSLLDPLSKDDVDELLYENSWKNSNTLLLMACGTPMADERTAMKVVRYLVKEKGADPTDNGSDPEKGPADYQDGDETLSSPLHVAAVKGWADMARFLVHSGAETYQVDRNMCTAFLAACVRGNIGVIRYLVEESGMCDEPFSPSVCLNHADMFWGTGLSWAVKGGHEEAVRYLVSKGADKTKCDKKGKAPIDYAREGGEKLWGQKLGSIMALLATHSTAA